MSGPARSREPAGELVLVTPGRRHTALFLERVNASRALHRPWVHPPATPEEFRAYLRVISRESCRGFLLALREGNDLVGVVNASEIVRGKLQSAYLGFYTFMPFARRGLMTAGLRLVLKELFRVEKLHRVEANIQPGNEPSKSLVKRLGFRCEGYSPRYLKIGGRWRDHERWALLAEEWKPGAPS